MRSNHHKQGRKTLAPRASSDTSVVNNVTGVTNLLIPSFLSFFAIPALFFLFSCQRTAEVAPQLPTSVRLRLRPSVSSQAGVRHADIFLYDAATGTLDAWQEWDGGDTLLTCSSGKEERIVAVIANLPDREFAWDEIRSLSALESLRCSLQDERPGAPVMTGTVHVGEGFDATATVDLHPLLSRVRLHSLTCDFSGRPYAGAELTDVRMFLVNAGSETPFFPPDATPYPFSYANWGDDSECDAFPGLLDAHIADKVGNLPVFPDAALYCYANPADDEGPGTPLTKLVIEGRLLGETWYYPILLPQPQRNTDYVFDITLTMTGTKDPDAAIDASAARVQLDVRPWEDQGTQIVPFVLRSADPEDEDRISDLNLFVFTEEGILQEKRYLSERDYAAAGNLNLHLLEGQSYHIVACVNIGYALPCATLPELRAYRYYLVYPDEYSHGLPMCGSLDFTAGSAAEARIPMERLLAQVRLQVDRSCLDSDISFNVRSVAIGNCPQSATLFGSSRVETENDLFLQGFHKEGRAVDPLNVRSRTGLSESIDLYLLENLQGELMPGNTDPRKKVLPGESPSSHVASYIEMVIDYISDDWTSGVDNWLTYRFYLGEGPSDFSVRRGCRYTFTVTPEGDGLQGDPWRIDRSRLAYRTRMELHPAAYNECYSSEDFHIWCDISPSWTPVTIEAVNYGEDEDWYDYSLDSNGHGITIHPRKGGTAFVYFSAGAPVNRDTLAILRVDP